MRANPELDPYNGTLTISLTLILSPDPQPCPPEEALEQMLTQYSSLISSRTRYLHGCIEKHLKPRAGLLLRKVRNTENQTQDPRFGDQLFRRSSSVVVVRGPVDIRARQLLNGSDSDIADPAFLDLGISSLGLRSSVDIRAHASCSAG